MSLQRLLPKTTALDRHPRGADVFLCYHCRMSNPPEGPVNFLAKTEDAARARERELLDVVLEVAGDDEEMIRGGVIKALHGVDDKARRTYLWNLLTKKAKKKIRRARRKFAA